jgi:very-short-patch-repair endonuclease
VAALADGDSDIVEGVPATSLPRTLLDLGAAGTSKQLERAVERAERLNLLDLGAIDMMLTRRKGTPGARRLEKALEIYRDPAFSRSRAELLFLDLVRKEGLPRPALNLFIVGMEVDAYWESERFAVEIDGWDSHRTRSAFETDPVRQEDLKLAGIDAIRITARRIEREPRQVGERLRIHLTRRRAELNAART